MKGFEFNRTGELFLERSQDGITRERPTACHQQSGAADRNDRQ
jgi:hypothetical protein